MTEVSQELMTPQEAARWFRRSRTWLRQQRELLRLGASGGQPLFHVRVCRAFVLGRLCNLDSDGLRRVQLDALAAACGLDAANRLLHSSRDANGKHASSTESGVGSGFESVKTGRAGRRW